MRVIAGTLKGRRLKAPTWDGLRPTSDKLRETLFNIVGARIDGPALLEERETTAVLRPGWSATVDDHGSLIAVRSSQA